jgi:DNA-directed RNA polymerase subunit H (RpoH/RPB5)
MNKFDIFQIEKNNEDIRKTVLKNLIIMLTERKLLKQENLNTNIDNIIKIQSDDYSYTINMEVNGGTIAVKMFNQKITAISKQSGISDFLYKNKNAKKIVIVKKINTKAHQYIILNYPDTEIFMENELMINLIDNDLVPKYEIIDSESEDFKQFCHEYLCKKRQIPKIFTTDPVARYYNLKKGDIIRVLRPSETSVVSPSYRITG